MKNDIAISVSNVSKKYIIGKQKESSLRGALKGIFNRKESQGDEFKALSDLNFEIKKGEVLGIIGKNGAGKSTLLKILSQITKPTTGRIEINGRIASLLEVGTGFHPELTGRENIYLNGTILGMSRKEVSSKFDEIVEFSGVEKFIDTPVKHYSSGMYVRLAFAVAAHLEPEILIIDEVLAVGDAEFQKKCLGKMKDVAGKGRTVIFVSHNISAVKTLCTKGLVLSKGENKFFGSIENASAYYLNGGQEETNRIIFKDFIKTEEFHLHEIYIQAGDKEGNSVLDEFDSIELGTKLSLASKKSNLHLTYVLSNDNSEPLFTFSHITEEINLTEGSNTLICKIPKGFLNIGSYNLSIYIIKDKKETIFSENSILSFSIQEGSRELGSWMGKEPGFIKPKFNWIKS